MYISAKLLNANCKVGMNKGSLLINGWRAFNVHVGPQMCSQNRESQPINV